MMMEDVARDVSGASTNLARWGLEKLAVDLYQPHSCFILEE